MPEHRREDLLQDLKDYESYWQGSPREASQRYQDFVANNSHCCQRSWAEGHCTGSAVVVSGDFHHILLLYHQKLGKWLQPGGHADGAFDLLEVARREAFEETGIPESLLKTVVWSELSSRLAFDLDIHPIPARGQEKEHFHYDLRYLFSTDLSHPLRPESPGSQVRWVTLEQVAELTQEESVLRLVRKLSKVKSEGFQLL